MSEIDTSRMMRILFSVDTGLDWDKASLESKEKWRQDVSENPDRVIRYASLYPSPTDLN
ncbi:hypothetical protein [Aliihoeflea sp. PC F10.4]